MSVSSSQKQTPQNIKDACIVGLSKGWSKDRTAKELKIHPNSIVYNLKLLGTSWKELKDNTSFQINNINSKKKQKTKKTTKNSITPGSPEAAALEIEEKAKILQTEIETKKKEEEQLEKLLLQFPESSRPLVRPVLIGYFKEKDAVKQATILDKLMKYFEKDINTDPDKKSYDNRDLPYVRPNSELADIQRFALHELYHKMVGFLEGARRTRKTSTVFRFVYEYSRKIMAEKKLKRMKVAYIASQGNQAETIHQDMIASEWLKDFCQPPYIVEHTATKTVFHNGLIIETRNTVTSDIKGGDYYVVIIDETDQLMMDKKKARAVADLLPTALTNDIKVIFMANRPEGKDIAAFRAFTNAFKNVNFWTKEMGLTLEQATEILGDMFHITLEQTDFPEMQTEEFKKKNTMVSGMQTMLVNKGYANSQLGDKDPTTGMLFPLSRIEDAVDHYDSFIQSMGDRKPAIVVMGIDTSGGDHPTGFSIWGAYHGNIYELYSRSIDGEENLDDDYIKYAALDCIEMYNVDVVVIESNSGGKRLRKWLADQYKDDPRKKFINQNFEGEKTDRGHADYVKVARSYMQAQKLFIKSAEVETQWGKYNPFISRGTDRKGDVADAALHAVFRLDIILMEEYGKEKEILTGIY